MNSTQLKKEIETKRASWNERSSFTIAGVKNLSPADLDILELYVSYFENGWGRQLMKPVGGVSDVLEKAGIKRELFGPY